MFSQALSGLILWNERLLGRELKEWEKEHLERLLSESLEKNPIEEPEQTVYSTGVTIIANARQLGKNTALKNIIEDYHPVGMELKPVFEATHRRCDCLKCRMGKPDQCTTYSPRKRGRK